MNGRKQEIVAAKGICLALPILGSLALLTVILLALHGGPTMVHADPIDPPDGMPKLKLSVKTVTPTLAHVGGVTLHYTIEILNTGAYTAADVTLVDVIPDDVTYNDDLQANVPFSLTTDGGTLTWEGDVGFDATTVVSFSVAVPVAFSGTVRNTAVISQPLIGRPITVTAETVVTDEPVLAIAKTSSPSKPGANKPLVYTIIVDNRGQPAIDLPITVTDQVPVSTTLLDVGPDGSDDGSVVTWTRRISLDIGQSTAFTFSVTVGDVPSGTIVTNQHYQVTSPASGVAYGEPYTVTIIDPIFFLFKETRPDPIGSNREATYHLTLFNSGSLATDLVITDRVPTGATYVSGGSEAEGVVSWTLPFLDTGQSAKFTFTVYISDVMNIPLANVDYGICSAENVCAPGDVLTSVVQGPKFQASAELDPIAKGPGGGNKVVTPTLVVRNLGPGNALDATAILYFYHISVGGGDLYSTPSIGSLTGPFDCDIGEVKCLYFVWVGDLNYDEAITFTTDVGQSTISPVPYTATVIITDSLSGQTTEPVIGTETGLVMHRANLVPTKSAMPVVGRGWLMTYTIHIWNSGLSTEGAPWLTDLVPMSTTVVSISDGGVTRTSPISPQRTVISWTLPAVSTGDELDRSFTVRLDSDLVSGTQILNDEYATYWVNGGIVYSNTGQLVKSVVRDVGLIDSHKEVSPTSVLPGPGNVLTYHLHVVNSGALPLTDVIAYDYLPWQFSTYQRDAVASGGDVVSDIVSIKWMGNVAPFSSEIVTFTVFVDEDYQGPVTNTAVISHPGLLDEVEVYAVAYVTEEPVLRITKSASPDPVDKGADLRYTIRVTNLGQRATGLVISDTIPGNTDYVAGGLPTGDYVRWKVPVLEAGESRSVVFQVTVGSGQQVVNDQYAVTCAEGVTAIGKSVITRIRGGIRAVYLPLVLRNAQ